MVRLIVKTLVSLSVGTVLVLGGVVGFVVSKFDGNATFPADCAIVFGAAVHGVPDPEEGTLRVLPGPGIRRRIETAAALYRQGRVSKVFLTGGTGEGMPASEASVMRDEAIRRGIRASDIVIEDQSHSTMENIQFIRPLIADCQKVIAISDSYHLARIELLAGFEGLDLETYPASGRTNVLFTIRSVIREAVATLALTVLHVLT